jgi:membrane-associated protein
VGKVLLWGGISAAAWNALLLVAGAFLVRNLDEFVELLERYTTAAWVGMTLLAAVFLGRLVIKAIRKGTG